MAAGSCAEENQRVEGGGSPKSLGCPDVQKDLSDGAREENKDNQKEGEMDVQMIKTDKSGGKEGAASPEKHEEKK